MNPNDLVSAGFLRNTIRLRKNIALESLALMNSFAERLMRVKFRIVNGGFGENPRAMADNVTLQVLTVMEELKPLYMAAVQRITGDYLVDWRGGLFDWQLKTEAEEDEDLFDTDLLDLMVLGQLMNQLQVWMWGGFTVEEMWERSMITIRDSLYRYLVSTAAMNDDPDEMALASANVFTNRVLNRNNAFSVIRGIKNLIDIGSSSAAGQITIEAVRRNPGVFGGIQWNKSLESNVCSKCEAFHGSIFDIDSLPLYPQHVLCQCHLTPVIRGYPASQIESFSKTFARLPAAVRREILGDHGFSRLAGKTVSRTDLFRELGI